MNNLVYGICIIIGLFFIGLFVGVGSIIVGLKLPLKKKNYLNICDSCNDKYKWYELLPIISFFLTKGDCKHCGEELNFWYPFLELVCGLLFSFSYMIYGFSYEMIVMIILTMMSIIIYVSDFKYFIISDQPLIFFSILLLGLKYYFYDFEVFLISICSGILIFMFMMMVRYIGNKIFKQESIGGGDIKLSMFFGFVFGIRLSIITLVLGSFLAFPYAIYSSLADKDKEIPFGPFLITGLYIVFVFMDKILKFISIIF